MQISLSLCSPTRLPIRMRPRCTKLAGWLFPWRLISSTSHNVKIMPWHSIGKATYWTSPHAGHCWTVAELLDPWGLTSGGPAVSQAKSECVQHSGLGQR